MNGVAITIMAQQQEEQIHDAPERSQGKKKDSRTSPKMNRVSAIARQNRAAFLAQSFRSQR
jgi:hypothetical protein